MTLIPYIECDLSEVFISTNGEFSRFLDLSEFVNQSSPVSLQLLQGKWLTGVFASSDQSNIHSNFQIIGPSGSGKSHLLSFYGIDHPKPLSSKDWSYIYIR